MKTLFKQFISAVVISAAFSFLVSCNESPNDPADAAPKAGSTYTFAEYEVDASGTVNPDSRMTTTDSLLSTSLSFFGSEGVHQVSSKSEYAYFKTFQNGSFDVYQDGITITDGIEVAPMWVHYDASSPLDTIFSNAVSAEFNGFPGTMTLIVTTEGKGNSSYTTKSGKTLSTIEIEKNFTVVVAIDGVGVVSTTAVTTKLSYSPELQYIVREEVVSNSDSPFSPIENGKSVRELSSYSIK